MKYTLFVFVAIATWFFVACKTKSSSSSPSAPVSTIDPVMMENKWKRVDSLEQKGLVTSALEEVRNIKKLALEGNHSGHLVKAITHENKYLNQLEEDAGIKALERLEKEIASYPEPAKSVMHSLAGQWYGQYLQGHLWELRNRTEFSGTPGPDIRTWGIRHLIDKIQFHYAKSVEWEGLKTSAVGDYVLLLTESQNTDNLRPTLFDILMHRALEFYAGTESFLTKPVYEFVLTDPAAFKDAKTFTNLNFPSADSLSNTLVALEWYKALLNFRLADAQHEAALVDADLKRLRFVYDHIVIEGKDSLYRQSLEELRIKHADNPEAALIDFYRAELLMQQAAEWQSDKTSPHRFAYTKAIEICRAAIAKFPEAYGSQLCRNLIAQMESKSLSAAVESVHLPNEELLAQIEYRNLSSIYLRLVRLPESPRRWRGDNWNGDEVLERLNQINPIKNWEQKIDDGDDYQPHTTEIPLQSLPLGHYALLISDVNDFGVKKSTTGAIMFTVSELGFWYIDDRSNSRVASIINRRTGIPVQGVKAEFFTYQYAPGKQRQEEIKVSEGTSDTNGWVTMPGKENQSISIRLTKGNDELFEEEGYHIYRYGDDYDANPTTLFFSDRSIYRPGQKIYFKGFALDFDRYRVPKVVARKNVELVLYDVNGQEQMKKTFTSNDYGTFSGHFDLPQGGLTGQMSLSSSHGASRHYFQVEEYKRPKFEIKYDTLTETVRLNENVTIRGFAKDFAGSPVSNADVRFRVERVSYRPWWYGYYWKGFGPQEEDRQVLTVGTTETKSDGSFDFTFLAKPKAGGEKDLMYRFETTAFITDVTGESHELTKSILLNNQGFEVNIGLPQKLSRQSLDAIEIVTQNSDGAPVKLTGDVEVSLLSGPTRNKRERLWLTPDIRTISDTEYAALYPNYHVPGKEEMAAWDVSRTIGKRSFIVTGRDSIDISGLFMEPGYYRFTWKWKDASGKVLDIVQHVMIYEEGKLLPGHEMIQVDYADKKYEPGQTPEIDLLTGLTSPPKTIRILERRRDAATRTWYTLPTYNDKSIKITEDDRGGIYMHYLTAYNNRFTSSQHLIQVPWANKDLSVNLKTWRDKMEPGDEETWTMTVRGSKGDAVAAEMLVSMYDASLDAFVPHEWQMSLYPSTVAKVLIQGSLPRTSQFWSLSHHWEQGYSEVPTRQYRDINTYGYYPEGGFGGYYRRYKNDRDQASDGVMLEMQSAAAPPGAPTSVIQTGNATGEESKQSDQGTQPVIAPTPPPLRSALDETVFFFPHITTDEKGDLSFSFKMKEGLTRWKFQGLAHTKDLSFGLTQSEAVTQKQLMVFPNPPRFFREGDTISFQIKATNLSAQTQTGTAQLKIIDALSNADVSSQWAIKTVSQNLQIGAGNSTPLSWSLVVPKKWTTPVKYQVSASAGAFTDGEESMIPVVTNRILITETLPLPMKAKESRTFVFKSMQANSSTLDHHRYTVEMTTSPAWYAVQALPYLMEYPHECAEQVFSRLYANTLASHIAKKYPAIKQVYDTWRQTNDDALLSNLDKNQELKSAMLEETPWVRDAMAESTQKKDIAILFETNKLRNESQQALTSLRQMQLSNGAFPWFPGGMDNWYITQYIVEGFGHLKKMNVPILGGEEQDIIQRAIPYLDSKMADWYDDLKRLEKEGKLKMEDHQVSSLQVHFLYTRSFFPEIKHAAKLDEVINYIRTQSEKYWLQHPIFDQGLIALGFYRSFPNNTLSKDILASLRERTIVHEELGRYWKLTPGFYWYEAPVELQSLMIELFQDMKVPQAEVDELRVWLLKQKQTTRWRSTKATTSAIYALLIHPDTWLASTGIVEVKIGSTEVIGQNTSFEAGTGYVKKSWEGDEIKDNWSTVAVKNPNNHIAWGAVYWQYWEDIDKVKQPLDVNPLQVTRSLLITRASDRGEITNEAQVRSLKVGDKLIVRLVIETDRAMEFVHLKDVRASGFEPMDVISGYRWNNGIGYYQSTRDLATHFFIDYLPRGKYVMEYPVTVAQSGAYSEGLASLQCMYAPEFADHSEGKRVKVSAQN